MPYHPRHPLERYPEDPLSAMSPEVTFPGAVKDPLDLDVYYSVQAPVPNSSLVQWPGRERYKLEAAVFNRFDDLHDRVQCPPVETGGDPLRFKLSLVSPDNDPFDVIVGNYEGRYQGIRIEGAYINHLLKARPGSIFSDRHGTLAGEEWQDGMCSRLIDLENRRKAHLLGLRWLGSIAVEDHLTDLVATSNPVPIHRDLQKSSS